jgi:hypothetical protein
VLRYAGANHAPQARLAQCVGLLAQATSQAAHAVLAARGEWVTNEKQLLTRAGLRDVDQLIAGADAADLGRLTDAVHVRCAAAVRAATTTPAD